MSQETALIESPQKPTKELTKGRMSASVERNGTSNRHDSGFQKANWYLSRLASMHPAEIAWRARCAAKIPFDWARWKTQARAPRPNWCEFQPDSYAVKIHSCGAPMGHIHLFDLEFPVGFDFDWHHDYRYDRQVERRFAGNLNIRDTNVVSDIKYVWEPNRHQHLSALAFAANAQEQTDYIVRSIDSWLRANPYLEGVHWTSSLELGERLISWALLYPRIAAYVAGDADFRSRWLASIYQQLARISGKLSLHSSANNHLIGELAGLFVGATCFNFWPECSRWREFARESLEREILIQIGEDGVNREQAVSYHLFTLELFLLAYLVGRQSGTSFAESYAKRLHAMTAFIDAIATAKGDLPWYGDSDDARGFLFSEDESSLEVTLQLGGLVFNEPKWLRFRNSPTSAARALAPDLLYRLDQKRLDTAPAARQLFPDAGLACLCTLDGSIRLLMDFGPLGFPAPAGHGHADALAIWLAIADEYFLIDSGTYAYHSHPEWRTYFRSTAAHNTVRIDGRDQSEMAGRFLWSSKATARLLHFESNSEHAIIAAEHDGYMRLSDPVKHKRKINFDRHTGNLSVEDHFSSYGRHEVEILFHVHEEAELLEVRSGDAKIFWRGRAINFSSPDCSTTWEILRGSEEPKLGWRSHRFNEKQPIPALRIRKEIDGATTICTHLRIQS
jgi:Heparinase II/III-like protein/Heparinase II/III N-terminus